MGCDLNQNALPLPNTGFQSTQPEWAATTCVVPVPNAVSYFNPRSPSGLRLDYGYDLQPLDKFQSTQPEWAATATVKEQYAGFSQISIHAARVGCDEKMVVKEFISI